MLMEGPFHVGSFSDSLLLGGKPCTQRAVHLRGHTLGTAGKAFGAPCPVSMCCRLSWSLHEGLEVTVPSPGQLL